MDKTLKRKIGYVAGRPDTENKEPKKKIEKTTETIPEIKETEEVPNEGVKMANWIKCFSILNKSALCKEADVDRGNLDKFLLKGEIPKQHIEQIKKVIKGYGYE